MILYTSIHFFASLFVSNKCKLSAGVVQQLHGRNTSEVQPQAGKVSPTGPQRPPALHQRGDTGSNTGKECHILGLT